MCSYNSKDSQFSDKKLEYSIKEDIQRFQYIYNLIQHSIERADSKISITCGVMSTVFAIITFISEKVSSNIFPNEFWIIIYQVFFIISVIVFLSSILFFLLAINPNLGSYDKSDIVQFDNSYPIFFGDIASIKDYKEYSSIINQATELDYLNGLISQTHYISHLCLRKYVRYRLGLWLSFSSVFFAIICLIIKSIICF